MSINKFAKMAAALALVSLTSLAACGPDASVDPRSSSNASDLNVSYDCTTAQDTGYIDGNPFPVTLVTVDGFKMQIDFANAFLTMEAAANAAGLTLQVSDGFRTMSQQQYYWACYQNCNCNMCNQAAAPGYSNHQGGHAVDINQTAGVHSWLVAHAATYGFTPIASESWHWEWFGGGHPYAYCSALPPDGYYCGGHGVSGDASTLYKVSGGALTVAENCAGWCATSSGGDFCAAPHRQRSNADLDGDGKADLCARAAAGVVCALSSGAGFSATFSGPPLSDAEGWSVLPYFDGIHYADVDGDGRADVCARAGAGIRCWLSNGTAFPTEITGPALSDANGWLDTTNGSTVQFADVNGDGKADLCARANDGMDCWLSNGSGFPTQIAGPPLSDAEGWSVGRYYNSIQMADVNGDGKADICARAGAGIRCWLSNGAGFPTQVTGPALSDASGWADISNGSTVQFADVNGDGKADVCARANVGMDCWLSNGSGFPTQISGPPLSDAEGWSVAPYYASIQLADVNGDGKADICARAGAGIRCWLADGAGFPTQVVGPALSDANGWADASNGATVQFADVNGDGKADVCARANDGMDCWLSNGHGFPTQIAGPAFSDASGWGKPRYFSTIQLVGSPGHAIAPATTSSSTGASGTSSTGDAATGSGDTGSTGDAATGSDDTGSTGAPTTDTGSTGAPTTDTGSTGVPTTDTGSTSTGTTGIDEGSATSSGGSADPHGGCGAVDGGFGWMALLAALGLGARTRRS